MRRIFLHIALVWPLCAVAQEPWIWSQYMFNLYEANIAYAGNPEAVYVSAHHRVQWTGWEGAPLMSNAIVQAPFFDGKMGCGLTVSTERVGAHRASVAEMAWAYKLRMGASSVLSFGLSGGVVQQTFFPDELSARDEEQWFLQAQQVSAVTPRAGAGVFFNSKRFFVGVDATNLNNPAAKLYEGFFGPALREFRFVSGLAIPINKYWVLRPSTMLRTRPNGQVSADISLCVFWNEKIWFGAGLRPGHGYTGMLDWSVSRRLRVGFSADLTIARWSFMPPSHEVFISYYFNRGANRPPSIRYF